MGKEATEWVTRRMEVGGISTPKLRHDLQQAAARVADSWLLSFSFGAVVSGLHDEDSGDHASRL